MGIFDFLKGKNSGNENKANIVTSCPPPEFEDKCSLADLNTPSIRDQLVLLLIAKTGMNNPRNLGLRLDRCDFPGNEGKSVSNLVDSKLVYFSIINGFGHPIQYAVTNLGEEFLKSHIAYDAVIDHIKQMQNPDVILDSVLAIFKKTRSEL
ncbi:hypothetical protein [Mucilaginibacter kameinonensis]|uniref:hypothetical protein n=1 Tax=Mucilaginibacter kameinonensis TaxID=452286 RepID=UPI000EF83837|nr:hypothetical protein [Mucilaginibacter kameinonensis]